VKNKWNSHTALPSSTGSIFTPNIPSSTSAAYDFTTISQIVAAVLTFYRFAILDCLGTSWTHWSACCYCLYIYWDFRIINTNIIIKKQYPSITNIAVKKYKTTLPGLLVQASVALVQSSKICFPLTYPPDIITPPNPWYT
jgi:hypothetical protein